MKLYNPFWNSKEHRIRSLFRLLIQVIILTFITGLLGIFLGILLKISPFVSSTSSIMIVSTLSSLVGIIFSVWLTGFFIDRRPFTLFGFHFNRWWWIDLVFGLFLGALLFIVIFFVELSVGWVHITGTFQSMDEMFSFPAALFISAILYIFVGIQEELFSRGYQLRNIAEGLFNPHIVKSISLILAWLFSSIIFGLLHAANPNASLISTLNIIIAGLFLGLGYILTGELAIPIGLHISWNFFQGNVFGFPVSGTTPFVTFLRISQSGPDIWTGGAFGPEAGLIGLLAMIIGCILILLWLSMTQRSIKLKDDLVEYHSKFLSSDQINKT